MNYEPKIESWARRELPRHFDAMIIEDQGQILAFGNYRIAPHRGQQQIFKRDELVAAMANRRTAMSYCVADHRQDLNLARQILQLDQAQQTLQTDVRVRQKVAERSSSDLFRERVQTKLQSRQQQLRDITYQLEKCISRAKYLQLRGFINETARTRRT
jgi:uncharacterized coiled-coil DUF342 family protein